MLVLGDELSSVVGSQLVRLLALLLFAAPVCYLIARIHSYRRLRHVPGPRLAAWTNLWYIRAVLGCRLHVAVADALKEYGRIHLG